MGALPKFWYYTNRFVLVLSWCKIQTEDYFYLHEPAPKKKIHAMRVLAHTISDMSNISSSSTASLLDHETHDLHMSIGARTCFDSAKKQTMATTKIIKKKQKADGKNWCSANGSTFDFDTSLRAACFILKQIEWCWNLCVFRVHFPICSVL